MIGMAVLGCGRIGRIHARNVARHPRAKLRAVFDIDTGAAQETAHELGTQRAGSLDEVWSDRNVCVVIDTTTTDTHLPLITAAVEAGKAVLCEKPVDLELERVRACWQEIAVREPVVMIGFNRRFDASYRSLRDRLQRGAIGKLELAVITNRDPAPPPPGYIKSSGGLMRDMTIHDFDMARYLAGDIAEVHAFGANLVDAGIGELGDIDTCAVTLRAKSGALLQINNSRRCVFGYDQRIEAFGSLGMLLAGNRRATSLEAWGGEHTAARDLLLHTFTERYAEAYAAELDAFLSALEAARPVSPDFSDGLEALRLAVAAEESARTGSVVKLC
ncbi:MAG: inositol 2-dehydrogenase [Gammaproteobacteria bacterium]|nr:inositol 2-dehydrogenase [Gammaproteobacteria bacterium]